MKVEITDVPDYTAVIESVRNGHTDIGIMSGFPSALAVNTGEVDPLVLVRKQHDLIRRSMREVAAPAHA